MPPKLDRRKFLELGAGSGLFFALQGSSLFEISQAFAAGTLPAGLDEQSPLGLIKDFSLDHFNGDESSKPHKALWDRENYIKSKGGRPTEIKNEQVVVIGGGVSGLLSTYFLKKYSPVLLEQAARFGGNAKGEIYKGTAFCMGAAYIDTVDAEEPIGKLLHELKLWKSFRPESMRQGKVVFQDKGLKSLWTGETDQAAKASILKITKELLRIKLHAYPQIPFEEGKGLSLEDFKALDHEMADHWLTRNFPDLHPHVKEYFQLYGWSAFGGSLEEISAAQFVNFIAPESDGVMVFPGGNAAIGTAIYENLKKSLGKDHLRSNCLALEVKNVKDGVEVLYEDNDGKFHRIFAKAAVIAAPKFVARKIITDLDKNRDQAWAKLKYRSYVVANVLLKKKTKDSAFDMYCLKGQVPPPPTVEKPSDRPWTDIGYAGWSNRGQGDVSILTIYKPYAFDGSRGVLLNENSFAKVKTEIETELKSFLGHMGLKDNAVSELRLTRWGHALPLAMPGLLTDKDSDFLRMPLDRIAFANQDNFASPAFEACYSSAEIASDYVKAKLG